MRRTDQVCQMVPVTLSALLLMAAELLLFQTYHGIFAALLFALSLSSSSGGALQQTPAALLY